MHLLTPYPAPVAVRLYFSTLPSALRPNVINVLIALAIVNRSTATKEQINMSNVAIATVFNVTR